MTPARRILNASIDAGQSLTGVGKISDIFAGSGITESFPAGSNGEGMRAIDQLWKEQRDGLIFSNLVDFDTLFGSSRNVAGYAGALEEFDPWLGTFLPRTKAEDPAIVTADHGNDSSVSGTNHRRQEVPLFGLHHNHSRDLGTRKTCAGVAATIGGFFRLEKWKTSFPQECS